MLNTKLYNQEGDFLPLEFDCYARTEHLKDNKITICLEKYSPDKIDNIDYSIYNVIEIDFNGEINRYPIINTPTYIWNGLSPMGLYTLSITVKGDL